MRRRCGVSRPTDAKPGSCTERDDVDPTRMSVRVGAQCPGRPDGLPCATGTWRCRDGSSGVSRGRSSCRADARREGPNLPCTDSHVCALNDWNRSRREADGPAATPTGAGSPGASRGCSATTSGDTMHETQLAACPRRSRPERPDAEPHVRWCGRAAGQPSPYPIAPGQASTPIT